MNRDDARPKLSTVDKALTELWDLINKNLIYSESTRKIIKNSWNEILDIHDINYNNLERWHVNS